jgi:hypothetical protein
MAGVENLGTPAFGYGFGLKKDQGRTALSLESDAADGGADDFGGELGCWHVSLS